MSGHDATCGPESSPPRSSDSKGGGEGAASGAFSCLKRLVSVLGVVLCVFIVAFVFALGWSNGWWGGQDGSASSDPDLYKVIDAESGVTHTEAIKNYVGMNAASVGCTGGSGIRYDSYGDHTIAVAFVAPDGAYVDPENDELLKQYVVTGQNLEAGSDVVFTAYKTKSGLSTIYGDYQSQDEVVLAVTKVGEPEGEVNLVPTESAPDKYTCYVKNYVGRNLASCGYIAMGGFLPIITVKRMFVLTSPQKTVLTSTSRTRTRCPSMWWLDKAWSPTRSFICRSRKTPTAPRKTTPLHRV